MSSCLEATFAFNNHSRSETERVDQGRAARERHRREAGLRSEYCGGARVGIADGSRQVGGALYWDVVCPPMAPNTTI